MQRIKTALRYAVPYVQMARTQRVQVRLGNWGELFHVTPLLRAGAGPMGCEFGNKLAAADDQVRVAGASQSALPPGFVLTGQHTRRPTEQAKLLSTA